MKGGAVDVKTSGQFIRVFDDNDFKELELKQGKRPMVDINSVVRVNKGGGFELGNPYQKYQEEKRQAERKTVADYLREVKTQNFLKPRPILLNKNPSGIRPIGINGANVSVIGLSNDYLIRGGTMMSKQAENAIKQKLKRRVEQLNAQDEALQGKPLISKPDIEQLPSEADTILTELDFTFDDFITSVEQGNLDANIVGKIQAFFKQLSRSLFLLDSNNLPRFNKYVEQLEIAKDNINIIKDRFEVDRPDLVAIGNDLISRIELILVILEDYKKGGYIYEATQSSRKKAVASIFRERGLKRIGNLVERLPPISTVSPSVSGDSSLQEMIDILNEPEGESELEGGPVGELGSDIIPEPSSPISFPLRVEEERLEQLGEGSAIINMVENAMVELERGNNEPYYRLINSLEFKKNFQNYSRYFGRQLPPSVAGRNKVFPGAIALISYLNERLPLNLQNYERARNFNELWDIIKPQIQNERVIDA